MKFAHLSDCHVGSWRDPLMKELNLNYFSYAIDEILKDKDINFVIISGDLFNTAVPSIEALRVVTKKLRQLKNSKIKCYGVAGSHDYSSSGRSMLKVLEDAGLFTDLMKGEVIDGQMVLENTVDESGAILCGISGKKGSLEKNTNYKIEDISAKYPRIFVFHSGIKEFLSDDLSQIESIPFESLPNGFDYYAGGHIHYRFMEKTKKGMIVFPGPTCPNNFKEWMDLEYGTFVIAEYINKEFVIEEKKINLHKIKSIEIDANKLDSIDVFKKIETELENIEDKLVLLYVYGKLNSGKSCDIRFDNVIKLATQKGAYWILKNTSNLNKIELNQEIIEVKDINDIELEVINETIESSKLKDHKSRHLSFDKQSQIIINLMRSLSVEKQDGENNKDFEVRVQKDFSEFLDNEL